MADTKLKLYWIFYQHRKYAKYQTNTVSTVHIKNVLNFDFHKRNALNTHTIQVSTSGTAYTHGAPELVSISRMSLLGW